MAGSDAGKLFLKYPPAALNSLLEAWQQYMASSEYHRQPVRSDRRNESADVIRQQREFKHRCHVLRSQRRRAVFARARSRSRFSMVTVPSPGPMTRRCVASDRFRRKSATWGRSRASSRSASTRSVRLLRIASASFSRFLGFRAAASSSAEAARA